MDRTSLFALLAIGALSTACQRTEPPLTPASGTRTTPALPDGYTPLSDDQIAGVTLAAHSSELQQARIALRRAKRKDVRDFAKTLIAHTEKVLNEGRALENRNGLAPQTSPSARDLYSSNSELVVKLNDVKRADFDREFVVSQIGNHEEILALLDARLLPEVRNGELRSSLEALRPIAEAHLERALELQKELE
jgi:predicted outer membrane protein